MTGRLGELGFRFGALLLAFGVSCGGDGPQEALTIPTDTTVASVAPSAGAAHPPVTTDLVNTRWLSGLGEASAQTGSPPSELIFKGDGTIEMHARSGFASVDAIDGCRPNGAFKGCRWSFDGTTVSVVISNSVSYKGTFSADLMTVSGTYVTSGRTYPWSMTRIPPG